MLRSLALPAYLFLYHEWCQCTVTNLAPEKNTSTSLILIQRNSCCYKDLTFPAPTGKTTDSPRPLPSWPVPLISPIRSDLRSAQFTVIWEVKPFFPVQPCDSGRVQAFLRSKAMLPESHTMSR